MYLHECFPQVGPLLNQLPVLFEEGAQEQAEVLDEVLLIIFPVRVRHTDVRVQRQHLSIRNPDISPMVMSTHPPQEPLYQTITFPFIIQRDTGSVLKVLPV